MAMLPINSSEREAAKFRGILASKLGELETRLTIHRAASAMMDALMSDGKSWTGAFREHCAGILQPNCVEVAGFRAWRFIRELRAAYPTPHASTIAAVEAAAERTWPKADFDRVGPSEFAIRKRLARRKRSDWGATPGGSNH